MPMLNINGLVVEIDDDGFLLNHACWNEEVAKVISAGEGIRVLTEEHWKVIYYLRNYYRRFHVAPMISKLCNETGCRLNRIYELFPSGPAMGACKTAGLPKPAGCV